MPLKRNQVEAQLSRAQADLDECVKQLDTAGVDAAQRRRDPVWRSLDAKRRQLQSRLRSVAAIETREADAVARKSGDASDES